MLFRPMLSPRNLALVLTLLLAAPCSRAQSTGTLARCGTGTEQVFHLNNSTEANDANEIMTALRTIEDPCVKLYVIPSQNAIAVSSTPEQLAVITRMIGELDRPHKSYRLTYILTESDNGKRLGVQHFSFIVLNGQRTTLKNGSKIPVATGTYGDGSASAKGQETQFTYLDIGLNFDATLFDSPGGARLVSKVEQSSVAEHASISGVEEPIIRQSVLSGEAAVEPGKPLTLGALDIPGSTRHLEVEVIVDPVR